MNKLSLFNSRVLITLFYAVLLLPAVVMMKTLPGYSPTIQLLIIDVVITGVVFLAGYIARNDSVYDPYWSLFPLFMLLYWISISGAMLHFRSIAMLVLVSFWSWRLTLNWFRGWRGFGHEDWRYTEIRRNNPRIYPCLALGGIYLLPTLLVFLAALPMREIISSPAPAAFTDIAGMFIMLAGILLEMISDRQLQNFRKKPENKAKVMQAGLWRYSRHPNYFGEILFWTGLWVLSIAAGSPWYFISGPAVMLALFILISIPMMEKKQIAKRPDYRNYKQKTAMLFPRKPHGL